MFTGKANRVLSLLFLLSAFSFVLYWSQNASANQVEIDQINRLIQEQGAQWEAGETSVSRLSPEVRKMRLGLAKQATAPAQGAQSFGASSSLLSAPSGSFDWRNYGYVTPPKEQGNCGACWAFAAAGALESQVAMSTGSLVDLSEQVLVSCSGANATGGGCNGGYLDRVSNYVKSTGIPVEECFPYTQSNNNCANAACPYWQSDAYKITGWHYVAPTVTYLKNALYTYGPLIVSMDVYGDFYSYTKGLYKYTSGTYQGGHAILLVGYDDSQQCFIVKNSWGADWGENGYFRIAYSEISSVVSFAQETIAYEGYTHSQTQCSYSLSGTSGALGSAGGIITVNVSANNGCWWTAVSNTPWITVSSGASVNGAGSVQLSVPRYTGPTRTGTATIAGTTFTLTQGVTSVVPYVAVDLGSRGVWMLQGGAWQQMSQSSPTQMATFGQRVVASFSGDGIYQYDGSTVTKISSNGSVENMIGADNIYTDSGGLWQWNGSWVSLSSSDPKNIAASGSIVYADFTPWGLWQWNGTTWMQIDTKAPISMVAADTNLYADYGGWGLFKWNGSAWSQISPTTPKNMVAAGSLLYVDFSPWGLWQYDGASWQQIDHNSPASMIAAGSNLYATYTGWGLWMWNGAGWSQLTSSNPTDMAVSGLNLYGTFGSLGIWQYNGTSWGQISTSVGGRIVATGN